MHLVVDYFVIRAQQIMVITSKKFQIRKVLKVLEVFLYKVGTLKFASCLKGSNYHLMYISKINMYVC